MNLDFNVNAHTLGLFLILLCILIIAAICWKFIDEALIRRGEREMIDNFQAEMEGITMPPWNGQTFEWPENLGGYLFDSDAPVTVMPVPPSVISGPLPELSAAMDDDSFMEAMEARTQAFIAQMAEPVTA